MSRSSRDLLSLSGQLTRSLRRPHVPRQRLAHRAPSSRAIASYTAPYQAKVISVIQSSVDSTSDEFQENQKLMEEVMARLERLTRAAQQGGSAKAREKHLARKKMLPRDRVTALIDPGTTFMELSPLAGHALYPEAEVPAGGIITGVGVVEGVTCMIVANDSTVKGGTYYPITVKKHLRAQAVAQENKLPWVYPGFRYITSILLFRPVWT
jgi:3-methylcrotonyl-CoA carboxylase beta subunit